MIVHTKNIDEELRENRLMHSLQGVNKKQIEKLVKHSREAVFTLSQHKATVQGVSISASS